MKDRVKEFERLLSIMDELRAKCPWDMKQTNISIRNLTIEEVYELADAIIEENHKDIMKELGDLMLHIVFYAKMASEENRFDIADVLYHINEKLIYRHPHVFGDVSVEDDIEVKKNWEELKMREGQKSVLSGVPHSLPALVKASRIQEKVRAVGFDWDKREQVWDKLAEEMDELKQEILRSNQDAIEDEFGDVFFSLVNTARLYDIDPETALERTNRKFISRFKYVEEQAKLQGKKLKDMSLSEMDILWTQAKSKE